LNTTTALSDLQSLKVIQGHRQW